MYCMFSGSNGFLCMTELKDVLSSSEHTGSLSCKFIQEIHAQSESKVLCVSHDVYFHKRSHILWIIVVMTIILNHYY